MESNSRRNCRGTGCGRAAIPALASESLCLDHFLDQTFAAAEMALEPCKQSGSPDVQKLEWLLADANLALQALAENPGPHSAVHRERIMELLLCLANLHEYMKQREMKLTHSD